MCRPRVYTGSATSASQGVRQRWQQYDLGLLLPQYIEEALNEEYEITHKGLLCQMIKPQAASVPVNRLLFLTLEATFAYLFWTMRGITRTWGMGHICPWDRSLLEYDGLCSHCSLNEGIHDDFDLTAEQLEAQAVDKEQKRRALKADNATNHHFKQMAENYDEYIGQSGERVARSRANNPGRDARHQVNRISKALDKKTFHCVLCNITFGTKQRLQDHEKTAKHLRKSKESSNPFKCGPCNLGFHNQSNLTRHEKSQCHPQNVAVARSSHELD